MPFPNIKNLMKKVSSIDACLTSDVVLTNIALGLTAETSHWTLCVGYLKKLKKEVGENNRATSTLQELEGTLRNINPQLDYYNVIDNESNDNNANKYPEAENLVQQLRLPVAEKNRGNDNQVREKKLRDLVRFLSYITQIKLILF